MKTGTMTAVMAMLLINSVRAFYSPEQGRWTSRDPIAEEGGVNLYAIEGNDFVKKTDYLGMMSVPWNEFVRIQHFASLKEQLKSQLKAMCPKSTTGWKYERENKYYCCKPETCKDEAERMAEAYIKALEHACRVRKYPGGGLGNYYIFMDGGWYAGQTYEYVEDTGLTCGGWTDMGQKVLEPITDKSKCWRYKADTHWITIEVFGYILTPHMWSSLQIMNGDKIRLDPWKSGGYSY